MRSRSLNYTRKMVAEYKQAIHDRKVKPENMHIINHVLTLAENSQKFILPEGGRLYDDLQYKALDETEELHLPFPVVALEWFHTEEGELEVEVSSSRRVMFVREEKDKIILTPNIYIDERKAWVPLPEAALPKTHYLDRSIKNESGRTSVKLMLSDPRVPLNDYADEVGALLCFLNSLQCANVDFQKQPPLKKGTKRVKGTDQVLPFDSYHILTIESSVRNRNGEVLGGGSGRQKREHLRRGHIRRYQTGLKIWVNATVVNPSSKGSVVKKDYRLK